MCDNPARRQMFTHTGRRPHVGYTVRGKLFGHQSSRSGLVHALNVSGSGYHAVCGETVPACCEDNEGNVYLDRDTNGDFGRHVFPVGEGNPVTCGRCRKIIGLDDSHRGVAYAPGTRLCRHCGTRKANRPRGMCWRCYFSPGVLEQYPSITATGRRGAGMGQNGLDRYHLGALPAESTDALPGSEEKIQVLERRAALGQSLFHPDDKREIHYTSNPRFDRRVLFSSWLASVRKPRVRKVHLPSMAS